MTWYTTGTVTLTKNSDIVYGLGTEWVANSRYGDILLVNDKLYEILQAENDLTIKLNLPYTGETLRNQPYALIRNMTNSSNYDLLLKINEVLVERTNNLNQFSAWVNGTATGGDGQGRYPLTNRVGVVTYVYCPAKMAAMAGVDQSEAIKTINARIADFTAQLKDYDQIKEKVLTFTGVTLESLKGQAHNDKLQSLSDLTFAANQIAVSISSGAFAAYPITDRALAFLGAKTDKEMRAVIGAGTAAAGAGGGGAGGVLGRRVAILGTSLCQLCSYGTATELSTAGRSWIGWAQTLTNFRMIMPIWPDMGLYPGWEISDNMGTPRGFRGLNAGVSRDHAPNILDRAVYLVNDVQCDIVILDDGINDVGVMTSDQIDDYRKRTVDYLLANGKTVILMSLLSPSLAYYPLGSDYRKKVERVNNLTRQWADGKPNLYFFDWTEYMMNFNDANGQPKDGYYTVEGLHFAPRGAFAVGQGLAELFMTLLPKAPRRVWSQDDLYNKTANPFGNMLANPFCYGNGGVLDAGATGAVSASCRVGVGSGDGSVVASKIVRDDGRGQWQQLVVTPGTVETLNQFRVSDFSHDLDEGTWVTCSVEVECDAWDGWKGIDIQFRDMSTGGYLARACRAYDGYAFPEKTWKGTLATPPIQIKAGGLLRWRIEVTTLAAAVGKGTVRFGAIEVRPTINPRIIVNAQG